LIAKSFAMLFFSREVISQMGVPHAGALVDLPQRGNGN
jgi:hypothetical protein